MFDIKDYIIGFDFFKDLSWFLLGLVVPETISFIKIRYNRHHVSRVFRKEAIPLAPGNVTSLDHGVPYYDSKNIHFRDSKKEFYLRIPDDKYEAIKTLLPDFQNVEKEVLFDEEGIRNFKPALEMLGLSEAEFLQMLNNYKKEVAYSITIKVNTV